MPQLRVRRLFALKSAASYIPARSAPQLLSIIYYLFFILYSLFHSTLHTKFKRTQTVPEKPCLCPFFGAQIISWKTHSEFSQCNAQSGMSGNAFFIEGNECHAKQDVAQKDDIFRVFHCLRRYIGNRSNQKPRISVDGIIDSHGDYGINPKITNDSTRRSENRA